MKRINMTVTSKIAVLLALVILLLITARVTWADADHIQVKLKPVGNSGITGLVDLEQKSHNKGTEIHVVAFGLKPNNKYLSLYYDNHVCKLEPYSVDDVIGGIYTANAKGVGTTQGDADDNLDEINSVSVRTADFKLLACANVHPKS